MVKGQILRRHIKTRQICSGMFCTSAQHVQRLDDREGGYLVVVHHRVERFNPHGINVPVQNNPLGPEVWGVWLLSHQRRQQTWYRMTCSFRVSKENLSFWELLLWPYVNQNLFFCMFFFLTFVSSFFNLVCNSTENGYHPSTLGLQDGWSQKAHRCPLPLDSNHSRLAFSSGSNRFYSMSSISF